MEQISKINVYKNLIGYTDIGLSEKIKALLNINLTILDGIEEKFFKKNSVEARGDWEITEKLREKMNLIYEIQIPEEIKVDKLVANIRKLIEKDSEEKNIFGSLLKVLNKFNQSHIKGISDFFQGGSDYAMREDEGANEYSDRMKRYFSETEYTKVFLSYAYEDKLYTGALYVYFLGQGIELYIDWIHNSGVKDGSSLKETLREGIKQSEQFLFLRSPNSELQLGSNYYVRPWCAWELGNYYEHIKNEKYYLNLYNNSGKNNKLIDGLQMVRGISGGRLYA